MSIASDLASTGVLRASYEAMAAGIADLCFLAIEPAREAEVAFTAPYVLIEGVFVVPAGSTVRTPADERFMEIRQAVGCRAPRSVSSTRR